ncbi:RnfABCDGE type electron transport complex subunit D [Neglectibacter timonensis]|uniref:Ion-translocating oxidoreductase complex subunit D n=2 Tax=Neglectibacter timonensis TaxID=1776382 RepID=A0ABT1RWA4_9FIRM|nr:RnfABCDGE type electron transport complex subunit D [Neglectibacter timonensis]MCQ4838952.1 RnfABCDGE type electron transport complex subunit D [Neglectibacter timonensis]MCQ4842824.1 RnfABCDGE type electron transport complex subunit D [Neglectibacter timonensis]
MEKLIVSSSPHFNGKKTTQNIMLDVIIALTPAMIASVILFGFRAMVVILTCIASCVLSEYICRRVMKRSQTVGDLSCVVTGILLALNLPVTINPLISVFGGVIAIVVVKQMFGGIGQNFVNPALTARIILMNSFPARMTHWTAAFDYSATADAVTTATPLGILSEGSGGQLPSYLDMFLGKTGGCLGETCALAILIGGIYLILHRVISPVIPVTYLATAALFSFLFGRDPLFDLLSGGLMLGAFFMATDYTTSPLYFWGRVVFAVGCGALTLVIREFGSLPEGVSYSIILMNILTPLIERYIKPRAFGLVKEKRTKEAAKS